MNAQRAIDGPVSPLRTDAGGRRTWPCEAGVLGREYKRTGPWPGPSASGESVPATVARPPAIARDLYEPLAARAPGALPGRGNWPPTQAPVKQSTKEDP
jgi:hypothetical protein